MNIFLNSKFVQKKLFIQSSVVSLFIIHLKKNSLDNFVHKKPKMQILSQKKETKNLKKNAKTFSLLTFHIYE